ncbi:alpha/beta fold hydrolase [Streptomyces wuyuanensis]|uniref:alpha/beta fold hydrolase n=1 Tax=Streptomyces wuyuanensis TaxID=1196353 RepID=UPI00379FCE56
MHSESPWQKAGEPGIWTAGSATGKPLVLVHGIRVSAHMWKPHARLLAPDFRVTACDLPGHGALAGSRFTLDGAVAQVRTALREASTATGRPVVLAGMSLGGFAALATTAAHPELVAGLLLNNSTAQPRGVAARLYRNAGRLMRWAGEERSARLNAALFRKLLPEESAEAVLAGGLSMRGFSEAVDELPRHDFIAMARRCTVPLQIVNCRGDRLLTADERAFLAAARSAGSAAELTHVKGTHILALTDPEGFTRILRSGYDRLTGGAAKA